MLPVSSSLRRVNSGRTNVRKTWCRLAWIVLVFVALDTTKGLSLEWATQHNDKACAAVVLCAKNAVSISSGLVLAYVLDGWAGVQLCLDMSRALKMFPAAACFCTAQFCMLEALHTFNAGSLKVMSQVNVPVTALLSWMILDRRYTAQQWSAIALLFASTIAFLQVRVFFFRPPYWSNSDVAQSAKHAGVASFLMSISISCTASILAERMFNTTRKVPFYIQKTNLMLGELLTACLMIRFRSSASVGMAVMPWMQTLDCRQFFVLVIWAIHGWIAGLLVKHFSGILKNASHVLAALVTYAIPLLIVPDQHILSVTICAILVLISILVFASAPNQQDPKQTEKCNFHSCSTTPLLKSWCSNDKKLETKRSTLSVHQQVSHDEIIHIPLQSSGSSLISHPRSDSANTLYSPSTEHCAKAVDQTYKVGLLVVSFIFLDAAKPLLMSWAHQGKAPDARFISGTFVFVQTLLSLIVGVTIAASPSISLLQRKVRLHDEWRTRVRRCFNMTSVLCRLPVSLCLVLSKLCLVAALGRIDAGTVRVFCQSSLPLVAVFSAVIFSRRYSLQQWFSLIAVSIALVAFFHVKLELQSKRGHITTNTNSLEIVGVLLILGSISCNCLGAFLVERFLKRGSGRMYEQKAQLVLGEAIVNAVLLFAMPFVMTDPQERIAYSTWHRGFFAGWDHRVFICLLVWIPAGWTATILVKECSILMKTVAQAAASVITYWFSILPESFIQQGCAHEPVSWSVITLAITVMFAALSFGMDSVHSARLSQESRQKSGCGTGASTSVCNEGICARTASLASIKACQWEVDASYRQYSASPGFGQPCSGR